MTAPQTRAIEYAGSRDVFPNPGRGFLVPYHPAQKDEILPPLPAERLRADRRKWGRAVHGAWSHLTIVFRYSR